MDRPGQKVMRCAIYTRKSTDHNLDLEFNSLDAQREACEAYIKSQAHEGWRLLPNRYDDGAFSGASLERPALQQLLAKVEANAIDIIVVYKVDRLTRSLADFAKLVELFDRHAVSFVSVTQSFNTTSSMGRLTLNVLLSFAQFEREVIGERVRDKIAASKRKGIWVGGPVPLGYAVRDKKVVIVPQEAETVRHIFRRYLALGSIRLLMQELERSGIRTRVQHKTDGTIRGGIRFGVGPLAYLLRNRFYIGEVAYRGEVHPGEHEPILSRELFQAVEAKLAQAAIERQLRLRASPALLTGRIFDDRGNRMSPTHTKKAGVRYRYYVSHPLLQNRRAEAGSVSRVSAPEIEALVLKALRAQPAIVEATRDELNDKTLIDRHVARVTILADRLELELTAGPASQLPDALASANPDVVAARELLAEQDGQPERVMLSLPWSATNCSAVKGILHDPAAPSRLTPGARDALLTAIARSRRWIDDLLHGRAESLAEIARRENKVERHVRLLAPLAFVSPRIIAAILDGSAPAHLTVTRSANKLPHAWAEQEIGI